MSFHKVNHSEAIDLNHEIPAVMQDLLLLNETDKRYLGKLAVIISEIEKKVSFERIFRTTSGNGSITFNAVIQNKTELFNYSKAISRIIERLTLANDYKWTEDQIFSCTIDIVYRCRDWCLADMINFIYHVRTNPNSRPEFVKRKLLPTDLMNMVSVYNDMRAIEHERLVRQLEHDKLKPSYKATQLPPAK